MRIEKAHLYVEKYSRRDQEMLLDFVREDEFFYFRNNRDYMPRMTLAEGGYTPTMLLIHGCAPDRYIRRGDLITVDMDKLLMLYEQVYAPFEGPAFERPATVCFEVQDGTQFAALFDDSSSNISHHVSSEFITRFEPYEIGSPCALDSLGSSFELRVWDVGQGNTNSISDDDNLVLFDFGASMYKSTAQLKSIISSHAALFNNKQYISLIISHWHTDHYNLLSAVDDSFLDQICCVFSPSEAIGLTPAQIAARIQAHSLHAAISPPPRRSRKYGIREHFTHNQYTLFTGERGSDKNKSGLLLEVHSTSAVAFLTADHTNYQVWDQMYNYAASHVGLTGKTLHIVVPHHGGDCGKTKIQPGTPSGVAAVSVGSNDYGHPRRATLKAYRGAQYCVRRTDRSGDIVIPMR